MRTAIFFTAALAALASLLPAPALGQANLEINTPAIAALQRSMQQRHSQLASLYNSGAVGFTRDGNVALRDAKAVPLAQRQQVNALIASENQDRAALYREIARANGHPEWENDIRATFAQRWISRAQRGWYYQNASGAWVRK
ncbi:MAG: YdbL family protein [Betaproteobacteria bacterium]|nr:MAG: cellobiose phosphorylase [Betaproteobacteria bacterium SG8_41]UCF76120.1 MAG: YdbL family protein [Betaproteobacteria bacterium]